MAVELRRFIKNQLRNLSPDHPDRGHLKGLLAITESYLERAGRGVAVFGSVDQAVEAYKSQLHSPELVTKVYQTIWRERGKLVDATYEVTSCPYTQEKLKDLEKQGKRVGYLPPELATQQSRHILGKMFPQMGSDSVQEGNPITNDKNSSGWFNYETGIDAPYLSTYERQLGKRIAKEVLLNLNQYIVAGQDSKLLTGQYLDEGTTCSRLGSHHGGRVVYADFSQDGDLKVYRDPKSYDHYEILGRAFFS